jgi:putative nucleotidyltransferase with HDIG domain
LNGDTVTGVTLTSAGIAAEAPVESSPYDIVPSAAVGTGLSNYSITYVKGSLTVGPASISLSLTSSDSTSTQGRSVTFTATVSDTGATGTVTFQDGETVLGSSTLIEGTATFTISTLSAGSHSITAVYSGDATFADSASSAIDLAIDPTMKAAGPNWALIGGLLAAGALLGLFLLLLIFRRKRKHPPGENAISKETEVTVGDDTKTHGDADSLLTNPTSSGSLAAADAITHDIALVTIEEVGTYGIQLETELETSLTKVQKSMEAAIQAVCRTVETKDPYVASHQKRVSQLACAIAEEMGLTRWQIDGIRVAGMLHDIGKITVPTEILSKPGKLSAIELTMIKEHPKVAFDILKNIEFDWPIARIVVQHHERMDGSGYPYGIQGKDILLEARILAVADVVEAMCTNRPYRAALRIEEALAELERGYDTLYDWQVVAACKKVINKTGFKLELSSSPS